MDIWPAASRVSRSCLRNAWLAGRLPTHNAGRRPAHNAGPAAARGRSAWLPECSSLHARPYASSRGEVHGHSCRSRRQRDRRPSPSGPLAWIESFGSWMWRWPAHTPPRQPRRTCLGNRHRGKPDSQGPQSSAYSVLQTGAVLSRRLRQPPPSIIVLRHRGIRLVTLMHPLTGHGPCPP